MKNFLFIFFIFSTIYVSVSQNTVVKHENVQLNFFYGKLIEHDKKLKNAIQNNPFGFMVSWNTVSSKNSKFNNLFNYPERGFSFLYENFNSTILGEAYGVYRHFSYNLTQKNNSLKLTSAFGLAYATKSYHKKNNNKNFAIGSKFLATAYVKLQYLKFFHKKNVSFNTAISLIHFSNFSFKNPNLGINTVALNFGINYTLNQVKIATSSTIKSTFNSNNSIHYNLIIRGGYNESLEINSGLYPFYTITFYGSKVLNKYSVLTSGIDYFNAAFLKNHIKNINSSEGKNYNENNYKRVGIFIGHELTQNNFSFISQIGYTIYYPFPYVSRIYERFGFKYKLSTHLFSEITMKVNLFRAEALEFGIGYQF